MKGGILCTGLEARNGTVVVLQIVAFVFETHEILT